MTGNPFRSETRDGSNGIFLIKMLLTACWIRGPYSDQRVTQSSALTCRFRRL
jgi:hypothetical protein